MNDPFTARVSPAPQAHEPRQGLCQLRWAPDLVLIWRLPHGVGGGGYAADTKLAKLLRRRHLQEGSASSTNTGARCTSTPPRAAPVHMASWLAGNRLLDVDVSSRLEQIGDASKFRQAFEAVAAERSKLLAAVRSSMNHVLLEGLDAADGLDCAAPIVRDMCLAIESCLEHHLLPPIFSLSGPSLWHALSHLKHARRRDQGGLSNAAGDDMRHQPGEAVALAQNLCEQHLSLHAPYAPAVVRNRYAARLWLCLALRFAADGLLGATTCIEGTHTHAHMRIRTRTRTSTRIRTRTHARTLTHARALTHMYRCTIETVRIAVEMVRNIAEMVLHSVDFALLRQAVVAAQRASAVCGIAAKVTEANGYNAGQHYAKTEEAQDVASKRTGLTQDSCSTASGRSAAVRLCGLPVREGKVWWGVRRGCGNKRMRCYVNVYMMQWVDVAWTWWGAHTGVSGDEAAGVVRMFAASDD